MKKLQTIATIVIILLMIVMNFLILWLMIDIKVNIKNDIGTSVSKTIENVNIPKVVDDDIKISIDNLKIGTMIDESVNKKVDSLNLKNGEKGDRGDPGKDSISTNTLITEKTIIQVPVNGIDGKTPLPRCNKNRWEISYNSGLTWKVMLDEDNKQVKCTP